MNELKIKPQLSYCNKNATKQEGFTLVEIIVVMIILGILATVALPRYIDLEANSKQRAIEAGISELNGRESLTWANQKTSATGYDDDQKVIDAVDYNLGQNYAWTVAPDKLGGTIEFKGLSADLNRTPSTVSEPAFWSR